MKLSFLLTVCMLAACSLKAQDTSAIKAAADTTAPNEMERMHFRTGDTTIRKLIDQMQKVSDNDRQNAIAIQGLLQGKEVDNMTKYKLLKNNVINAAQTYYLLNKKIIDLKSRTTTNNLDVFITSLNNPESKALGFSFSERIIDLVKTIILQGRADKSERGKKIVSAATSIINSPIFKSFTALTPPLGIANSIMTFFQTLSINNKSINENSLKKFEEALNKYVLYYTALNEGNQKFEYGLNFNKDQLNLLHQNLYDHLAFTASAMGFTLPPKSDNKPLGVLLNQFFLTFNKEKVEDYFNNLESKYTIPGTSKVNYERLLRENTSLKEVNNQLEELVLQTKRYDNLYNEYFTLLDNYYSTVIGALNVATQNGLADKTLVQQKQQEFTQLKNEAVQDIKASINIDELKNNTDNIKYRYKIF